MRIRDPLSRRARRMILAGLVVGLGILIAADRLGLLSRPMESDRARYHNKTFTVLRVVDGDTLDLDVEDLLTHNRHTRVRLWGVDTPETHDRHTSKDSSHRQGSSGMYYGPEASAFTKGLVLQERVRVQLEPVEKSRGTYGRLLAYIFLPDGRMLNEELLKEGYGYADERYSHMHRRDFAAWEQEARREHRGLWQHVKPEQMPAWRRKRRRESER